MNTPSLQGQVSPEEWPSRVDLAAAYRLVVYGWSDLVFNHTKGLGAGIVWPALLCKLDRLKPGCKT